MNKKLLLVLFLCSCFAEEREAIKKTFTPAPKEEKKEAPKKELTLKTPDEWKICETLKATAKNLAPGCWEEVANRCVKGKERVEGECPICHKYGPKTECRDFGHPPFPEELWPYEDEEPV